MLKYCSRKWLKLVFVHLMGCEEKNTFQYFRWFGVRARVRGTADSGMPLRALWRGAPAQPRPNWRTMSLMYYRTGISLRESSQKSSNIYQCHVTPIPLAAPLQIDRKCVLLSLGPNITLRSETSRQPSENADKYLSRRRLKAGSHDQLFFFNMSSTGTYSILLANHWKIYF